MIEAMLRVTLADPGITRGGARARLDLYYRSCALMALIGRLRLNVARSGHETIVAILAHGIE
jgi:hypothetical protein